MTVTTAMKIVDTIKTTIAQMVASAGYRIRPTAIYANPVLLRPGRPGDEVRVQRGAEHHADHRPASR